MSTVVGSSVNYQRVVSNQMSHQSNPRITINGEQVPDWGGAGFVTPPRSCYGEPWMNRSQDDLSTLRRSVLRPVSAVDPAKVAPEIEDISRTNGSYHVQVNLNANFLNPLSRPSSVLPTSKFTSEFMEDNYVAQNYNEVQEYRRPASVASHYLTGYLPGTLTNHDSGIYNGLIATDLYSHAPVSTHISTYPRHLSPQRGANSTAVVNIDASRNSIIRSRADDSRANDDFIIKSIKSAERSAAQNNVDDNVELDLQLFGRTVVTESAPVVESINVEPKRKPPTVKKSRRSARVVEVEPENMDWMDYQEVVRMNRSAPPREINSELEVVHKVRANAATDAEIETKPKSCNTDPEVISTGVQTLSVSNSAVQTDFQPDPPVIIKETMVRSEPRPIREEQDDFIPQPKFARQRSRQINIQGHDLPNHATEDRHVQSSEFIELLREGAPRGSFRKKLDVKKESDQILGPLPKEEVERMYDSSMINVDSVSEKVELTLANGIAQMIVKITYERIVPIEGSQDTFKKSAVVVTKVIDVDLTVTEERRKIYEHIIESHGNGRLDNKYTFELYKAFIALSEGEEGHGTNQEHFSIEKKVDEEKLWNLNSGASEASERQVNLNILENKLSDFSKQSSTMTFRSSVSSEPRSFHQWGNTEANHAEPPSSYSFEWKGSGPQSGPEMPDAVKHGEASAKGSVASYNRMLSDDLYRKTSSSNWKSIFNTWTEDAIKQAQNLTGHSSSRRLEPRMNAYEYLRPGGNRTQSVAANPININSMTPLETPEVILENAGIQPGSHRQRMNGYLQASSDSSEARRSPISTS